MLEQIVTKDTLEKYYNDPSGNVYVKTSPHGADYSVIDSFSVEECTNMLNSGCVICFVQGDQRNIAAVNISDYLNTALKATMEEKNMLSELSEKDYMAIKEKVENIVSDAMSKIMDALTAKKPVQIYGDGCFHDDSYYMENDILYIGPHHLAAECLEAVEDQLELLDLTVPDEDRCGEEGEARLYGETFSNLLDELDSMILEEFIMQDSRIKEVKEQENEIER